MTCHGITLLPQFLGMYRVTVDNEDTYLTVTRNMFSHRLIIHRKYDLKVVLPVQSCSLHALTEWRKPADHHYVLVHTHKDIQDTL